MGTGEVLAKASTALTSGNIFGDSAAGGSTSFRGGPQG
jgi:hypothetical protein